jgi:hypothetical protein
MIARKKEESCDGCDESAIKQPILMEMKPSKMAKKSTTALIFTI